MNTKVENMVSNRGNKVSNQFIIRTVSDNGLVDESVFQSYDSAIAKIAYLKGKMEPVVMLDKVYWDYSVTTSRYRNQFLGETKKETQAKIDSGEYILTDLNG